MSPWLIILFVFGYFGFLMLISWWTTRGGDSDQAFFTGNRQSPWYIVAFGMIGTSLSGVTFISVPGWVESSQFAYLQMVLGYLLGYLVVGLVLMPLYYRLKLTSIYTYLLDRFGMKSYKTGAWYFLISRIIGASFRLYLVAIVFQFAIFDQLDIDFPFSATVLLTIVLIWVYSYKGGIKTIVWTDTLQTLFMLLAVGITIAVIGRNMDLNFSGLVSSIGESQYSQIFFVDDWRDGKFFLKQFLTGAFITIAMTGLDQDMMQKNLTCKNIGEAKKNMFWFSITLVFVNLFFLSLGALLYMFANSNGIALPEKADYLYPILAVNGYLGPIVAILFILGLIAAAYSSADSALTALTTSFCVDILGFERREIPNSQRTRKLVHLSLSAVLLIVIVVFEAINNDSVIKELFVAAGYTYGPLLGLFSFGMFTKYQVKDRMVPMICILAPIICYFIKDNSVEWFNGYQVGFELLIFNGLLTFTGLYLVRKPYNASSISDPAGSALER
ncbi:MAG: sodium:solute symporter [Crocinitomicaceae bacterium]|nr:sodium:solute symporter [Crocinitomicaceae bacterium]|tara:strand:+ start:1542 stop:3041 length:1500 start_codon:yes stop_codon:yes gene_type:complete